MIKTSALLASFLILLGLATSCGIGDQPHPLRGSSDRLSEEGYKLATGDVVKVTVFGQKDLSGKQALDGRGYIAVPLIGRIHAEGLSTRQLARLLEDKFDPGYLINPSVSIELAEHRPFYILGEVEEPGAYEWVSGMTVENAVAIAGGFTYRADQDDPLILREGSSYAASEEALVSPGDIVRIEERFL